MLDYENQRKLVIAFVLAFIIVIILTILVLIMIWMPKDKKEDNSFKVGKITKTNSKEESVVKRYYEDLYILFLNKDIDKIYELTGKDYIEYLDLDKDSFTDFLLKKGVLGKGLELVKFTSFFLPDYNNVYEFYLKAKDEAYSINITLRETSPENYTLAFEMFIDYKKDVYKAAVDSIEMNILKMIRYTNSVQYEISLRNNYNKQVTINEEGSSNPIILVNYSNEVKKTILNSINIARVTINPKEKMSCTLVYNIEDNDDYYYFNRFIVKDVKFQDLIGSRDIEFVLK